MSDLLSIGLSGVNAYRTAMAAIGENVANAETPGFSRRSVRLAEADAGGNADPIYRDTKIFGGVEAVSVQRAWDAFRAVEARHALTASSRAEVRERWLTAVETALDDSATGVGGSLNAFFAAGTNLAAAPGDRLRRANMLTALENTAAAFRSSAERLQRVSDSIADGARIDVDGLNGALASLHEINGTIRAAVPGGTARAAMEDERDRLIDAIAERMGVEVTINPDGTAYLNPAGASGTALLDGTGPARIGLNVALDGRLAFTHGKGSTTSPLPLMGGRLSGLAETATATADRRAALDQLAIDFAAQVNTWSAAGVDANGDPGAPLLGITAGASTLTVLTADPNRIAAANAGGANGNLLALDSLRGAGRGEARWGEIVSSNAQILATVRSEAAAAATWRDQARASLDEVTGIDLDREAAELLRFQQAYGGATRILQVARESFNSILDLF